MLDQNHSGREKEMSHERTAAYRKDPDKENLLEEMNCLLAPVNKDMISDFDAPKEPTLFVIGAPRSATTLIHQILAQSGSFGYISNYIARFYRAPYIGALQAKALDLTFKDNATYESNFGRTEGWHEPHQFNYYWKRWYQYDEDHQMKQEVIDAIPLDEFRKEIAALESVFKLPMVFKSLYCGLQIDFLKNALPKSKFVLCTRDPLFQAQSILKGRVAFFGTYDGWFSLKPQEYEQLSEMDAFHQVAGQIFFILNSIGKSLRKLDSNDFMIVDQQDLVEDTRAVITRLINLCGQVTDSNFIESIPQSFENRNIQNLNDEEWIRLGDAIDHFFEGKPCKDVVLTK